MRQGRCRQFRSDPSRSLWCALIPCASLCRSQHGIVFPWRPRRPYPDGMRSLTRLPRESSVQTPSCNLAVQKACTTSGDISASIAIDPLSPHRMTSEPPFLSLPSFRDSIEDVPPTASKNGEIETDHLIQRRIERLSGRHGAAINAVFRSRFDRVRRSGRVQEKIGLAPPRSTMPRTKRLLFTTEAGAEQVANVQSLVPEAGLALPAHGLHGVCMRSDTSHTVTALSILPGCWRMPRHILYQVVAEFAIRPQAVFSKDWWFVSRHEPQHASNVMKSSSVWKHVTSGSFFRGQFKNSQQYAGIVEPVVSDRPGYPREQFVHLFGSSVRVHDRPGARLKSAPTELGGA